MFFSASELKGNLGCVLSLSGAGTLCLVEARNRGNCHWGLAEPVFLLLAVAAIVEAVVRVALAFVVSLLFLAASPILFITDGPEETCCRTIPKHIPEIFCSFAYTGVRTACNSLVDLIALVQNLTKEKLDYDRDLVPCCSSAADKPPELTEHKS
jgi:hypothetical protein